MRVMAALWATAPQRLARSSNKRNELLSQRHHVEWQSHSFINTTVSYDKIPVKQTDRLLSGSVSLGWRVVPYPDCGRGCANADVWWNAIHSTPPKNAWTPCEQGCTNVHLLVWTSHYVCKTLQVGIWVKGTQDSISSTFMWVWYYFKIQSLNWADFVKWLYDL